MLSPFLFQCLLNEVRGYTEGYTRNLLYTPRYTCEPNNNIKNQTFPRQSCVPQPCSATKEKFKSKLKGRNVANVI